jgi:pimeloyl-ACP methyl ester carboxylesterase
MTKPALEHDFIKANGLTFHVVMAGPVDGPVVVLLHGFPEFWYGFRHQIPGLAAAGFRVWAVDQRGYNLSDKPKGVKHYGLGQLAADAIGVIQATGREQVGLVGHDWGAMVAWCVALLAPERLRHVAILNVPHPVVARRHLLTDPRQMARSTYAMFFQLPWLPESMIRAFNWRNMERTLRATSLPGAFTDEDLPHYRRAWAQPGAMTAMLNWYRAAARRPDREWPSPRVRPPTTVIWGKRDFALRSVMAEESVALCEQGELIWLPDNTHWLQHEAPGQVNAILINRFKPNA